MKKTTTGEIKWGLRKNVRRCKDLFQGLLETPNCRRDRLVSCINQTVDLTKLNIGLFNFSVYKPAYYTYNELTEMFEQRENQNPLFPCSLTPIEMLEGIEANLFIVLDILQ